MTVVFRRHHYGNLSRVTCRKDGIFATRENDGSVYRIEGGRRLGGSRREWLLTGPAIEGHVNCVSVRDALLLVDGL